MSARLPISALISDVDGTLVTPAKVLTARAKRAVADLRRHGIAFAIVSARPPEGMRMFVEPLGLSQVMAGFNGGAFVRPDLTLLEERLLAPDVAHRTLDYLDAKGVDAWVFAKGRWFIRNPKGPKVDHEAMTVQFAPTVVEDFGPALDAVHKMVGVSDDYALLARCEAEVQRLAGRSAAVVRSQAYYLDVTNPDANKGVAVHTLAKLMGVPLGEVAVIGDGLNDVAMFAQCPFSIAMGNASDEVKAKARFVTESNEEDGFARAVERYLLAPDRGGSA
ncbi:MAG: HAD family phosphatase [Proteobacteria bacterium]|nr:HAD family phosphatase [Pseudomonadota bacterium]